MDLNLRMKRGFTMLLVFMLSVFIFTLAGTATVHASVKMPGKLYKQVKGKWYTESSSGGYNVRFTKTKVKYYSRRTNRFIYSCKLVKVKKIKKGQFKGCYRLVYKYSHGKFSYINENKKAKHFECFNSSSGYKHYSGSGGLWPGTWF